MLPGIAVTLGIHNRTIWEKCERKGFLVGRLPMLIGGGLPIEDFGHL